MFTFSTSRQIKYETASYLLMVTLGRQSSALIGLIVLYLGGFTATRSRRVHIHDLEECLPVGAEVVLARWLAVVLVSLIFALIPLSIAIIAGPLPSFLQTAPIFLFETVLVVCFSAALIWIIETVIGLQGGLHLLPALLWIISVMAPILLNNDVSLTLPGASLLDFSRAIPIQYTETWGRLFVQEYALLFDITHIAATVFMLAIVLSWKHYERFFRVSLPGLLLLMLSLVVILVSGGSYALKVQSAYMILRDGPYETYADARFFTSQPSVQSIYVSSYDINLHLDPALQIDAELVIINVGDTPISTFGIALNNSFTIIRSNLDWEHNQDFLLTITPDQPLEPGETLHWDVSYEGSLYVLELVSGAPPRPRSFIDEEGIRLDPRDLWYPRIFPDTPVSDEHQSAYTITVQSRDSMTLVSNLTNDPNTPEEGEVTFTSQKADSVLILGSPRLSSMPIDKSLTLIATRFEIEMIDDILRQYYIPSIAFIQRYFENLNHVTIVTASLGGLNNPLYSSGPQSRETTVIYSDIQWFGQMPDSENEAYIYSTYVLVRELLETSKNLPRNTLLTENIAYFLWVQYRYDGDPQQMNLFPGTNATGSAIDSSAIFSRPTAASNYEIAQALLDVYTRKGESSTINIIKQIQADYATFIQMPPTDIAIWILEQADD